MNAWAGAIVEADGVAGVEAPVALFVDADARLLAGPALHMLRQNGLAIDHAATAEAALAALEAHSYAMVILEIAAEGFDGPDLCRRIVAAEGPPVMIWSRQRDLVDQVAGLELGADDYVAKAAHPLELLARSRAMLRRRRGLPRDPAAMLSPGAWTFDETLNCVASWRGTRSWLTPGGAALLRLFCARPREPIERMEIVDRLNERELALRTVDIFVSRLRRALAASDDAGKLIRTIPRKGYLLDAAVQPWTTGVLIRM
jgi:two-component system OmpR family response regulator